MHSPQTYIARTESAVRKLFEGIESYTELLRPIRDTTFVGDQIDPAKFQVEYEAWAKKNAAALDASMAAQRAYSEQAFAMATLCGSVLQVAAKAIECYSSNQAVPSSLQSIVGDSQSAKPFCIGREVRAVPIGLIIFAGRNQHTHFNEPKLNKVNVAVFERLAVLPEVATVKDPALDLDNPLLESYASNITFILGWRSYDTYAADLGSLLGI
jgi:hypothetical protein